MITFLYVSGERVGLKDVGKPASICVPVLADGQVTANDILQFELWFCDAQGNILGSECNDFEMSGAAKSTEGGIRPVWLTGISEEMRAALDAVDNAWQGIE